MIINIHIWKVDLQIRLRWREQPAVKVIAVPEESQAKLIREVVEVL